MKSINNDDKMFIEKLGRASTELRISDWTRDTIGVFIDKLENAKK